MFFKYAILNNRWFFFHLSGATFLYKFFLLFPSITEQKSFLMVMAIAILYELYQRFIKKGYKNMGVDEELLKQRDDKTYWQKKIFWLDSYGDLIAAVLGIMLGMW